MGDAGDGTTPRVHRVGNISESKNEMNELRFQTILGNRSGLSSSVQVPISNGAKPWPTLIKPLTVPNYAVRWRTEIVGHATQNHFRQCAA